MPDNSTPKFNPKVPLKPLQSRTHFYNVGVPMGIPKVEIIASARVVQVGEAFSIKVAGSSSIGLRSIWWAGIETGIKSLDEAHWHLLTGENFHEEIWQNIIINEPGLYTFGANSRDVLYGISYDIGHQASEGTGISQCVVEVRKDISYLKQIDVVKLKYQKSDIWEDWMKRIFVRARYEEVWERSRKLPTILKIAFQYGGSPLEYNPPWQNETQHMMYLDELANLSFPGFKFEFLYGTGSNGADIFVEVGGKGNTSYSEANYSYLYYETIFGYEFAHVLGVQRHFAGADIATKVLLPPEEEKCIMARNGYEYCSACRAAMHLDLYAENSAAISTIADEILSRYTY